MEIDSRKKQLGFATRTQKNLEFVMAAASDGADVHPVTQMTNSLLGLIVFPWESDIRTRIRKSYLAELTDWPKWSTIEGTARTLRDLLDHLRNAIAHGNITYSSESKDMDDVHIEFTNKAKNGSTLWKGRVVAADLRRFCLCFTKLVEDTIG